MEIISIFTKNVNHLVKLMTSKQIGPLDLIRFIISDHWKAQTIETNKPVFFFFFLIGKC